MPFVGSGAEYRPSSALGGERRARQEKTLFEGIDKAFAGIDERWKIAFQALQGAENATQAALNESSRILAISGENPPRISNRMAERPCEASK